MATGNTPFGSAAEGIMGATTKEARRRKIAEAIAFLKRFLGSGPQLAEVVLTAAAEVGIAEGTLYYAKRALQVTSRHQSYHGPWVWALPDAQLSRPETSQRRRQVVLLKA